MRPSIIRSSYVMGPPASEITEGWRVLVLRTSPNIFADVARGNPSLAALKHVPPTQKRRSTFSANSVNNSCLSPCWNSVRLHKCLKVIPTFLRHIDTIKLFSNLSAPYNFKSCFLCEIFFYFIHPANFAKLASKVKLNSHEQYFRTAQWSSDGKWMIKL